MRIVTSFVFNSGRLLILRRHKTAEMGGLWSCVSGIIEDEESPESRARTEIIEETGICARLVRSGRPVTIRDAGKEWEVWPFLFEAESDVVRLDRENSEYRWIEPVKLSEYDTVPGLAGVLACL